MVELALRLTLAATLVASAIAAGAPPIEPGWRVLSFFATYSVLAFFMERRGMRNSGVSGLFGVADSGVVLALLASVGRLEQFGFLALGPTAYAAFRHGADAVAMAPITAAMLLASANMFAGPGWTPVLLAQAAAVLLIGLLGARRTKVVTVKEIAEAPQASPLLQHEVQTVFELREKFRVMRDHAKDVEARSRRDRLVVKLREACEGDNGLESLGKRLLELLRVEGIALYALNEDIFHVQTIQGTWPATMRDQALRMPEFGSEWQLRDRLLAEAVTAGCSASTCRVHPLKVRGRWEGLLLLTSKKDKELDRASEAVAEVGEALARMLTGLLTRERQVRRLLEAELLYHIAGATHGADTADTLIGRVSRDLWDSLNLDHLSVCLFRGGEAELVAQHGASISLLDPVRPRGQGDTREVWSSHAAETGEIERTLALKGRIGGFALVPVGTGGVPVGYLAAVSHRAGILDAELVETLRLVASEMAQALVRLESRASGASGLATPAEFYEVVQERKSGWLVYLEVIQKDEVLARLGQPALDAALRRFALALRRLLPPNAVACRRVEGDYMVLLGDCDEPAATSWAATATASAAMVPVVHPANRTSVPLSLKSKVSQLTRQSDRISSNEAKVA